MKAEAIRTAACGFSLLFLSATACPPVALGQSVGVELAQQDNNAPIYSPPQLDQLLAPIALYPDSLLAQILMASTYPLEVVEAARWVQDRNNARLRGDQLDAALQPQNWDPSVKSLVPFPQVLAMMDGKLDWTQALGNAFLAQQADVMSSVQRLRAEAQAAGTLQSTPQDTVSTQDQAIVIEPANPRLVYVPYYDPTMVYGSWAYPDYPPIYFPPPPNYGYVPGPGIYFGLGFGIVGALWGWDSWDWRHHDIYIDPDRFNRINNYAIAHDNHPRYTGNTWQHDPAHRRGVPYGAPAVRQKFQPAAVRAPDARRDFRGFDNRGATPTPAATGRAGAPPGVARTDETRRAAPGATPRPAPGIAARPPTPPAQPHPPAAPPPRPAVQRPAVPAFSSLGTGPEVRAQSQRGQASRQAMVPAAAAHLAAPAPPPRTPAPPQHSAPAGGGQKGGGNEKRH